MLFQVFETHGNGEEACYLHADNCGGQNKNKTVIAYLAWRCMVGVHHIIIHDYRTHKVITALGSSSRSIDGLIGTTLSL